MEVVTGFLQAGIEFINYDSGKKPVIADNSEHLKYHASIRRKTL